MFCLFRYVFSAHRYLDDVLGFFFLFYLQNQSIRHFFLLEYRIPYLILIFLRSAQALRGTLR
jgi:hypothetical protein